MRLPMLFVILSSAVVFAEINTGLSMNTQFSAPNTLPVPTQITSPYVPQVTSIAPSPVLENIRDERRVVLPNGKVCFEQLLQGEDGPELVTTCPESAQMVKMWDEQANKAAAEGKQAGLGTAAPPGCTCGTSKGTPVAPSCGPDEVAAERKIIEEALARVLKALKDKYPGLGDAWWGNLSGGGPKCNEVAETLEDLWQNERQFLKGKLKCLQMAALFDSGMLPFDLQAHIACGVINNKSDELLWVIDPWRYGNCDLVNPDDCPNSWDDVIPWPNY